MSGRQPAHLPNSPVIASCSNLKLEITENVIMKNGDASIMPLQLKALGMMILVLAIHPWRASIVLRLIY